MTPLSPRPPSAMPHTDYEPNRGQGKGTGSELCPRMVRRRQPSDAISVVVRMPRRARHVLPGVAIHAIQRGNNRGACFRVEADYRAYLTFLREALAKYECALHAYCLMSNHVHLLMTPPSSEACAGMMRELGQRYTRYFNRRYARTGTLWEGRFRSCVTDSARYLIACYRYIELNPVRAGICMRPDAYPWSSHAINIGRRTSGLVTPHPEFVALGTTAETRVHAYAGLVEQALDPALVSAIRKATHSGQRLGTEILP